MSQGEQAVIEKYIRDHSRSYTDSAITSYLLSRGYSREAIDRAWATVQPPPRGRSVAKRDPRPARRTSRLALYISLLLILAVPSCLLSLIDQQLDKGPLAISSRLINRLVVPINLLFVITQVGFLAGTEVLLRRGWQRDNILGLFLVVNFVWLLIILGTCSSTV